MMNSRRQSLELLLRTHKLDGTLTSATRSDVATADAHEVAATGIAIFDDWLDGGFPRGQLSEVVGPPSSGRTSLLCAVLAGTTQRGELVALIDPQDTFDPESGAAAGIELTRLLWIRGNGAGEAGVQAIRALHLVLNAGGFGVVALDVAGIPAATIRRVPFTTWMRIQRAIEGSETTCVLLGSQLIARSPGGLSIVMQPAHPHGCWVGESDRARLLDGLDILARVKCAGKFCGSKVLRFTSSKVQRF